MSGMCLSIIRCLTAPVDPSSGTSAFTWINPPRTVRAISASGGEGSQGNTDQADFHRVALHSPLPPQGASMSASVGTVFTGLRFENPFLLASAPPTESDTNTLRAFEAGRGG